MAEETTGSKAVTEREGTYIVPNNGRVTTAHDVVWGYGDSDEAERYYGHTLTREDAIAEGRAHYGKTVGFWVIQGHSHSPSEFTPDADWLLEEIGQRASDTVGEAAEEWPDGVTPEQKKELQELLDNWVNKNLECRFWTAEGQAEYIEPEEKDEPASNDAASIGGG